MRDIKPLLEGIEVGVGQLCTGVNNRRGTSCPANPLCWLVNLVIDRIDITRCIGSALVRVANPLDHQRFIETNDPSVSANDTVEVDSVGKAREGTVLQRVNFGELDLGALRYLLTRQPGSLPGLP